MPRTEQADQARAWLRSKCFDAVVEERDRRDELMRTGFAGLASENRSRESSHRRGGQRDPREVHEPRCIDDAFPCAGIMVGVDDGVCPQPDEDAVNLC